MQKTELELDRLLTYEEICLQIEENMQVTRAGKNLFVKRFANEHILLSYDNLPADKRDEIDTKYPIQVEYEHAEPAQAKTPVLLLLLAFNSEMLQSLATTTIAIAAIVGIAFWIAYEVKYLKKSKEDNDE